MINNDGDDIFLQMCVSNSDLYIAANMPLPVHALNDECRKYMHPYYFKVVVIDGADYVAVVQEGTGLVLKTFPNDCVILIPVNKTHKLPYSVSKERFQSKYTTMGLRYHLW